MCVFYLTYVHQKQALYVSNMHKMMHFSSNSTNNNDTQYESYGKKICFQKTKLKEDQLFLKPFFFVFVRLN